MNPVGSRPADHKEVALRIAHVSQIGINTPPLRRDAEERIDGRIQRLAREPIFAAVIQRCYIDRRDLHSPKRAWESFLSVAPTTLACDAGTVDFIRLCDLAWIGKTRRGRGRCRGLRLGVPRKGDLRRMTNR
jgi:hypothetical protein